MTDLFLLAATITVIIALIALIRLIIGPSVPDRVVAVDTINT